MKRHVLLYIINILLLATSLIVSITGLIKFPGLLDLINIDPLLVPLGLLTWLHDWLGLLIVLLTLVHLALNWKWIRGMTGKLTSQQTRKQILFFGTVIILVIILFIIIQSPLKTVETTQTSENSKEADISEPPKIQKILEQTKPQETGIIKIEEVGEFTFPVDQIKTTRPDVFIPGFFSVFDVLVFLDSLGEISLDYHYSEAHGTHMIDSINGIENWWYIAYYDGGWAENNVWPLDLFPFKDHMTIQITQESPDEINAIHANFLEQMSRTQSTNGVMTIPEVVIRGQSTNEVFENVEITAHDLRGDYFQAGTLTAMDVILSLGDAGLITYQLNWYESIGYAGVVKNYFVDEINKDAAFGRCGFVYEMGNRKYYGFRGNHIHIPADLRVINSVPDYVEFFWICI